ncbi:uncharacterized protein B0H18DRAFT_975511 [Fomitopsis serialis]|uniref:uncharacterized protein n=1 Tax=Fomitopsis serialis TaxID=139415 RepID=UPI002008811C|nr:uncharacterized protein B0H18DRAFT_975511 [Neoantrodia serialis]KAH9935357.1 hypothetical protein B0H18DRAFT_975511 [Neoantrodia serialis]
MPVVTPRRQNTAPQPTSTSHALGSSPPSREPARKPSSSSVAQRRDKSLDRIVIFPTDPYGKPLEKELPDTPSLYTPTNFGPPSPTTKPYMPPVPSLPSSLRVGTNASFDTPLSSLRLSPGIQLRQLPGVQHSVEVSKPRASVVAASGFMAEIVSQPEPLPSRSKKHEHRDRDRDRSERGRRERREERRAADPAQHVKGPIYGPSASTVDPVRVVDPARVYVPPTYRSATQSPSQRAIYASPTAIDRTRAEPSTVYGSSRSPQASTSTGHLKSKRSDYGGLYSGYSRP